MKYHNKTQFALRYVLTFKSLTSSFKKNHNSQKIMSKEKRIRLAQLTPTRWAIRPQINGIRARATFEAPTRKAARKAAEEIIIQRRAQSEDPSLRALLDIYMGLSGANLAGATLKPETARKNAQSLLLIARRAGLNEASRLSELSGAIVESWRHDAYKRAGLDIARPNPAKNTSLNATFRQARSVFCARALAEYERRRIKIPQGAFEFCKMPELSPVKKCEFKPIDESIDLKIRRFAAAALDGKRGADLPPKDVAVMVEMARYAGMTLREMMFFSPSWVLKTSDGTFINVAEDGEFTTKRGTKNRKIPVRPERLAKWLRALRDCGGFGDPHNPNLSQTYKYTCLWLSRFLPGRAKKLHELRKMACSDMLSRTGDIFLASKFIGNSISTTVKYYAGLITKIKPL